MQETKAITLPEDLRARLDWFTDPAEIEKLCGFRAKKALLISLDFSKPLSPERETLFSREDGDVSDLYLEPGRIVNALSSSFDWNSATMLPPPPATVLPKLEPQQHFPWQLLLFEPVGEIPRHPYDPTITADSSIGSYVRERLGGDWAKFQAALVRLGFSAGNIFYRHCACCERPVRSNDPQVKYCRSCDPRPPDPDASSDYATWKENNFRAKLPGYSSLVEVEKSIRKTKLAWQLYSNGGEIDSPDFAIDAIGWFFYEGLYGSFDPDAFLNGVVLTTAETLVNQHGFSWKLDGEILFITHPGLATPVKVENILSDYGFLPPEEDDIEVDPDADDLCRNAVRTLSSMTWPPLTEADIPEACERAEADDGWSESKVLSSTDKRDFHVDYEKRTFALSIPDKSERFHTEYYGEFRYRDGQWIAVITSTAIKENEESTEPETHPVILAAESGDVEKLRQLIDQNPKLLNFHGGDFDLESFSADTPLACAAANGHAEAVRFLLERGAKPFRKPHHPCPALLRACANGHVKVVKVLLDHGVPIQPASKKESKLKNLMSIIRDEFLADSPSPLLEAAKHNHAAVVRLLLERGADPLKPEEFTRSTVLHESWQFPEVLELLLKAGVPIDVRDKSGKTPLHRATLWGSIIDLWRGQDIPEENLAEARMFRQGVENLIARGADINARDQDGETPLHLAAQDGSREYIHYFLDHGADRCAKNNDGKTPLDYAEDRNNKAGIELLMIK